MKETSKINCKNSKKQSKVKRKVRECNQDPGGMNWDIQRWAQSKFYVTKSLISILFSDLLIYKKKEIIIRNNNAETNAKRCSFDGLRFKTKLRSFFFLTLSYRRLNLSHPYLLHLSPPKRREKIDATCQRGGQSLGIAKETCLLRIPPWMNEGEAFWV